MKKIYSTICVLLAFAGANQINAQLTVSGAMTPAQLVTNVLLGSGVTVSNITYTGATQAIGSFTANSTNLGITGGVLMTCGAITNAPGPNNQTGASVSNNLNGDPDLDIIMNPTLSYDASILEFDFSTTGDSILFRYVFASEEYMEYVSSTPGGINDGFGFFLSGPGINGPFTNNAENLAIIPNTTLPVTMFNVNCTSTNSAYYVCNDPQNTICASSFSCPGSQAQTTIQYDGMTVVLTARHAVQCNQTYHIKLAIGDGGDHILDSGVFLEAGSFSATNINVVSQTSYGGSNDSTLWEGCGQACMYFTRDGNFGQYDTLSLSLSGTATNGVDFFPPFPSQIIFVPGQDTITLCVTATNDGTLESLEDLVITATSAGICVQSVSQATLYISDYDNLDADAGNDTAMCTSNPVTLTGTGNFGTPPYSYQWSNGANTSTTTVTPTQSTPYILAITDACGYVAFDTVNVFIPTTNPLVASAGPDREICPNENPVTLYASASGGALGYQYSWTTIAGPDNISGNQSAVSYTATGNSTFEVTIVDACGNTTTDQVVVDIHPCELVFPNVFTPNGDINNEYFEITGIEYFPNSALTVYNRWGSVVFQSNDYQNNWSPKDVSDGTYYYVLDASDQRSYSGFVTIIR